MSFCEKLCNLKAKTGESNYRIAKSIGVTQMSVSNWCRGKSKPLPVYLEKLAEHFGVTVEQLKS